MVFPFCNECANNDETCSMCNECQKNNGEYFVPKLIRPKVILIMAVTADGIIAKDSNHFTDWTGREDKKYFQEITKEAGAVIMGRNTFETLGAPLPDRLNIVMTSKTPANDPISDDLIFSNKSPVVILHVLKMKRYKSVCLIGGSRINTAFMHNGLIDEIHLIVAPKLFGSGLTMFSKPVNFDVDLKIKSSSAFEDDHMLIVYDVIKNQK